METWLSGKKSYLVAVMGVTGAVYAWLNGVEIPNEFILAYLAGGTATLRAGIKKVEE